MVAVTHICNTQKFHKNTKLGTMICMQRICNVKKNKSLWQSIMGQKNFQKCHWVHLVLASWVLGLVLKVICIHSKIPSKKDPNFLFVSCYQLEIASGLGCPFPLSMWDPIWPRPVQPLCMLPKSLSSYMHSSCYAEKVLLKSFRSSIPCGSCNLSAFLL